MASCHTHAAFSLHLSASLLQLLQTRYILAEYVELDVHTCAHLDVAEVGVVVCVGDDSHGE